MYNNRLLQWVAVVVVLMALATSGVAAASAPTGPERNVASSHCLATLRQELGTVMPSGRSGYQESDCSVLGAQPAALSTLDNPNGHWIGPETVSAALGQMAAVSPLDNPNGQWTAKDTWYTEPREQAFSIPTTGGLGDSATATGGWRDAGASGQQLDTAPTAGGVLDPTRGY